MDCIILEGMIFYGYHGLKAEEKSLGQRFIVDLKVELDLSVAGNSDQISDTAHYGNMYRVVKRIVEGKSKNLIEAVAEDVATTILKDFNVSSVSIKISKPDVPIKDSILKGASVELHRPKKP